jgi:glycogen(starch) synthase
MRILVVSNFYPPFFVGGYEVGCQRVVEALRKCGHVSLVLTSNYEASKQTAPESDVLRQLHLRKYPDYSGGNRAAVGLHNVEEFRKAVASFQPDLIYAWNLHSLGIPLIREIEEHPVPHVYYVSDFWMLGPSAKTEQHRPENTLASFVRAIAHDRRKNAVPVHESTML